MADAQAALAEQFDDLPQQTGAATLGMWTFLATEILFFGGLFLAYIIYRHAFPAAFSLASQHTLVLFGTANTAILLTSSLTMALAVNATRQNRTKPQVAFLLATVFAGAVFLVLKGFEYRADVREHLWPGKNFRVDLPAQAQLFWFLYWVMTGLHALHVLIGLGLLSVMAWLASRDRFSAEYHAPLEISGLYWHFVDIVWIFLYPLLYLAHRSA